jgi:hypothetical protein
MNCLECRDLLQKRLDGAPVAADALDAHLLQCAACREQHAGATRLLEALKKTPEPRLPVNFAQTMAAQVMDDRRHRQQRMRRRVYVTMALAASVVIVLMFAYAWLPRPDRVEPKPPIVRVDPKKETPNPEVKETKQPEPRHALTALTGRVADTTRDHAKVVLAAANLEGMDKLPAVELPMNPGMREAGQEVTDGVRTVTRSARKAFDFFARELPMPDVGAQQD